MIMTGEADEAPREVSYRELFEGITRAANLFHRLAGPNPGVALVLPNLGATHFVVWGAETAGYAVPVNFLVQAGHIADLLRAAGERVLVTLVPHPPLDSWEKAV